MTKTNLDTAKQKLVDFVNELNTLSKYSGKFILEIEDDKEYELFITIKYSNGNDSSSYVCHKKHICLTGPAANEPELYFEKAYNNFYNEINKDSILNELIINGIPIKNK